MFILYIYVRQYQRIQIFSIELNLGFFKFLIRYCIRFIDYRHWDLSFPRILRMVIVRIEFYKFSSVLELEDERIQMPLQCIRILLHRIRMLLPAFRYLCYSIFRFAISCANSCLIHCDSLYSFLIHIIMLIGLISKHYIEFLIVLIEF